MQIVKLGGSLITAKRSNTASGKPNQKIFRAAELDSIAKELKKVEGPMIIVHGAGSFGHVEAHRFKLHELDTDHSSKQKGIAIVSRDVRELNLKVMKSLTERGLHGISILPNVTITNKRGCIRSINLEIFNKYLELGLTPVTFGDLVPDTEIGVSICSGDDIMIELAKAFKPERAIFVTDVDGVYDKNPRENKDARLISNLTSKRLSELLHEHERKDGPVDVTGGMFRKAEVCLEIAKLDIECLIINGLEKGRLGKALNGKEVVGTYFH
jgi:isopentenyl phosphate kinase